MLKDVPFTLRSTVLVVFAKGNDRGASHWPITKRGSVDPGPVPAKVNVYSTSTVIRGSTIVFSSGGLTLMFRWSR